MLSGCFSVGMLMVGIESDDDIYGFNSGCDGKE
jgi:hypothetical protein